MLYDTGHIDSFELFIQKMILKFTLFLRFDKEQIHTNDNTLTNYLPHQNLPKINNLEIILCQRGVRGNR
jgi:hypothetical protein